MRRAGRFLPADVHAAAQPASLQNHFLVDRRRREPEPAHVTDLPREPEPTPQRNSHPRGTPRRTRFGCGIRFSRGIPHRIPRRIRFSRGTPHRTRLSRGFSRSVQALQHFAEGAGIPAGEALHGGAKKHFRGEGGPPGGGHVLEAEHMKWNDSQHSETPQRSVIPRGTWQ